MSCIPRLVQPEKRLGDINEYLKFVQKFEEVNRRLQNLENVRVQDHECEVRKSELEKFATIDDLKTLVEDLQNNLDYLMSSTPRQAEEIRSEITKLKLEIEELKKRQVVPEVLESEDPPQTDSRSIPKIQFVKRK